MYDYIASRTDFRFANVKTQVDKLRSGQALWSCFTTDDRDSHDKKLRENGYNKTGTRVVGKGLNGAWMATAAGSWYLLKAAVFVPWRSRRWWGLASSRVTLLGDGARKLYRALQSGWRRGGCTALLWTAASKLRWRQHVSGNTWHADGPVAGTRAGQASALCGQEKGSSATHPIIHGNIEIKQTKTSTCERKIKM